MIGQRVEKFVDRGDVVNGWPLCKSKARKSLSRLEKIGSRFNDFGCGVSNIKQQRFPKDMIIFVRITNECNKTKKYSTICPKDPDRGCVPYLKIPSQSRI